MAFKIGKTIAKWTVILSATDYIIFFALLVFSLVIISKLGANNYGVFTMSSTLYVYTSKIFSNIFLVPFIKLASGYYGKKEYQTLSRFMGSTFIFIIFISLLQGIVYFLTVPFVAVSLYSRSYILDYMFSFTPVFIALGIIGYGKRFLLVTKSYTSMALTRILDGFIYIVAILVFVYLFSWSVEGLVYGTLAYNFALAGIFLLFIFKELRNKGLTIMLTFNLDDIREIISAGKYFLASNIFFATFSKVDELIIPIFVSNVDVGFYSFAKAIIIRLTNMFNRLNSLLYQAFSEQVELDTGAVTIRKLLNKSILYTWLYTIPVSAFFIVFAREVIMATSFIIDILGYLNASYILGIFSLIIAIEPISAISSAYFNGLGRFDMQAKANFIMVSLASISVFVLTSTFGIYGASVAFVMAYLSGLIYWIVNARKHIKINIGKTILYSILAVAIGIIIKTILFLVGFSLENLFLAFVYVIIVGVCYFGAIVFLVISISIIDLYDITLLSRATKRYPIINHFVVLLERIYKKVHREEKQG